MGLEGMTMNTVIFPRPALERTEASIASISFSAQASAECTAPEPAKTHLSFAS